jgi:hypothetical protein
MKASEMLHLPPDVLAAQECDATILPGKQKAGKQK